MENRGADAFGFEQSDHAFHERVDAPIVVKRRFRLSRGLL